MEIETSFDPGQILGFNYLGNYNGSYYYKSQTSEYWQNALDSCQFYGGHLAIEDSLENEFIKNALPNFGSYWIGYYNSNAIWRWVSPNTIDVVWSNNQTIEYIHVAPNQTTTYYVTASNGISSCQDSVTVNVLPNSDLAIDTAVCDSIFFAGNNITSGMYYDTLTNAVGCDSVVTMNLTIHNSKATNDSAVACDNYTWNGNVYDTSGIYIDTLQTIHGCDSIVTMDLTINNSYYIEES